MKDKDLAHILPLLPRDAHYIFTAAQSHRALPAAGFFWLLAGGVLYTVGGVLYAVKWPGGTTLNSAATKFPCVYPAGQCRPLRADVSGGPVAVSKKTPFAGSGSTLVAAKKTRRRFIGVELDDDYYQIAQRRVEEAVE